MQEFLETFGLDHLVQDRFAPFTGKLDFFAKPLDAFFEPSRFFRVGNMHVLQRESTAIGALHDVHDFAHGRDLEP